MRSSLASASLVALLVLPAAAQTLPTAGERIQVTVVEVPVNVVDKAGNSVRNLSAANFEVYDGGQRRKITHFDAIDLTTPAGRSDPNPAASRNFMLVFDLNGATPGHLARAKEAARLFVKSNAVEDDNIGVGVFSIEEGFRLLASFTTDRKLVTAAINSVGAAKSFQPADPLLLTSLEFRELLDESVSGPVVRGSDVYQEELKENIRNADAVANDNQRQFIRRTLDGYADLAHLLDRVPGRKQVILLTEGFDAKMIHGRESLTTRQAREEEQYVMFGEAWRVDTDNKFGDAAVADDLNGMLLACRRSDVVVHAIDIKGVRSNVESRDVGNTNSNESLFLLTHGTGGMVMKNANSLEDDFQRLMKAEEVVYVLGFETPSSEAGRFHELKVKLVDVPGGTAFHRSGYFESSPASTPIERTLTASEIIVHQIPKSDLRVHSIAMPFPRSGGKAQVPVIVEVDGRSLMRAAKGNEILSELYVYAFDDKNVIHDFVHQPVRIDLAKLRARLQYRGLRVYETLMLPPGHYSIRTLVRAGKESLFGYTDTAIEVPQYDQTAILGGSAIDEKPMDWVPVKPPDRQGVPADYPFAIGGSMLVPQAAPVLQPGVAARVGLYLARVPDSVDIAAQIDGRDTPVNVAARTTGPDGGAKLLLDITPPALPPGDYRLTLRIAGPGAKDVAVVPFAVH